MLNIGAFANLTGLSVKALRHYDAERVLVPADIDASTGYRRYGEWQVRDGAIVRALREADVPLADVRAVLDGGDDVHAAARAVLERHRMRVLADRERHDLAMADAGRILAAFASPAEVTERDAPATPFVGVRWTMPIDGEPIGDDEIDAANDRANAELEALFVALQRDGIEITGDSWATLRGGDRRDELVLECSWPTSRPVPAEWPGLTGASGGGGGAAGGAAGGASTAGGAARFSGELPARRELVATWRPPGDDELPTGTMHPAAAALADALARRGVDADGRDWRQGAMLDPDSPAPAPGDAPGHEHVIVWCAVTIEQQ